MIHVTYTCDGRTYYTDSFRGTAADAMRYYWFATVLCAIPANGG